MNLVQSEQYDIIKLLLRIQGIFGELNIKKYHNLNPDNVEGKLHLFFGNFDEFRDDQERYLKMALKIEPNDPVFLVRNENADLNVSV